MPKPAPDLLKALALLAAALVCAGLANGWATARRKLDWTGWTPPPAQAPAPLLPPAPAPAAPPAPEPVVAKAARAPRKDALFAPSPGEVIRDITSAQAWEAFRLKFPFLDARRSSEFEDGHVAGAWSVPVWEADAAARITEFEARANPAPEAPMVLYCSGGDCEDSRLLAQKLVQLGYRNLLIYRDGFPDWARQGRPRAKGARP